MAFDFSTLVTDRTLEDVTNKTAKGFYNASDLNRVDACLEDIVARLRRMGYNVPGYWRLRIERETKPASRLPEGYTQVEYIQSSGAQYIDTRFKPNQNTRVAGVFTTTDTGIPYFWWGARTSSETVNFCTLRVGSGVRSDYGESKVKVLSSPSTKKVLIDQSKNICTYATTSIKNEISTFVSQYSLFLFAANTGGRAGYFGHHKMYSCKIYDNETLVRDFVPCKNATGAVGLYDQVEGKFYDNAGSGSFTAGPVVTVDTEEPPGELDPHTWYETDTPTFFQLSHYRDNIASVRSTLRLPERTPETPETIRQLDYVRANNIEQILGTLDQMIVNIQKSWYFSGDLCAGEV